MKESIVDTWKIGMHPLEYLTILMIVAIMGKSIYRISVGSFFSLPNPVMKC